MKSKNNVDRKNDKQVMRRIVADALYAVLIPIIIHTATTCGESLISVFTAETLGKFADSVFRLDFSLGRDNILRLVLSIVMMIIVLPFFTMVGDMLMLKYSLLHDRTIISRFFEKSPESVMKYEAGDIQNRLDWSATDLRCDIVELFYRGISTPVGAVYLAVCAVRIDPLYAVITVILSLVRLAVPIAVRRICAKYDMEAKEYSSKVSAAETEIMRRPVVIRMFGLEEAFIGRFEHMFKKYFSGTFTKNLRLEKLSGAISSLSGTLCSLSIILIGALFAAYGRITPGSVAAMYGYFTVIGSLVDNIGYLIKQPPKTANSARRLMLFYEDHEKKSGDAEKNCGSGIAVKHLSFSYEGQDGDIIHDLSINIHEFMKTVIVGENGCGKSTLMKLLCGLITGYRGSIRFGGENGTELYLVSPDVHRGHIAYVPQDPYLFKGTVFENVRLGKLDASDDEVLAVISKIGIEGLADREIGYGGNDLSGGERQKIAIARALIKDADIIFMDEPGNNLDKETLEWLCDFIRSCDRTLVYISHTDKLTAAADRVIELKNN